MSDFWNCQSKFSNGGNWHSVSEVPHTYSAWICHLCFALTPVRSIPIEMQFSKGFFFFRGQKPSMGSSC